MAGIYDEVYSQEINTKVEKLFLNEEVYKITSNFIDRYDRRYFLHRYFICRFERVVGHLGSTGRKPALLIDCSKFKSYLDYIDEKFGYIETNVEYFWANDFKIFSKIILQYGSIENDRTAEFCAYLLIWKVVPKVFGPQLENLTGSEFIEINNLTIEEIVERFCGLDFIDSRDECSIGILSYHLFNNNLFSSSLNFIECFDVIAKMVEEKNKELEIENLKNSLLASREKNKYTIHDIDLMTGIEFEKFLIYLFSKLGYKTTMTRSTGDQGVDIIAEKNGIKVGIQAKCYSKLLNNKSIQEIAAGIAHYKCDKGIVVTNNYFTKSAMELAQTNRILLWDRRILSEKIETTPFLYVERGLGPQLRRCYRG